MTLSSDQSPTATPLFLLVQEKTQSFPRLRIKPVHNFFYEFRSKLNHFHGSRLNRYNCLKLYRNTPQLSKVVDLQFSHNTIDISLKNKINRNKIERFGESNNGGFLKKNVDGGHYGCLYCVLCSVCCVLKNMKRG